MFRPRPAFSIRTRGRQTPTSTTTDEETQTDEKKEGNQEDVPVTPKTVRYHIHISTNISKIILLTQIC